MDQSLVTIDKDTYLGIVIKTMKENTLEENVRKACNYFGLLRYHTYRSTKSPAGFPDDVIIGKWVMFRELKRQNGKLSPYQRQWIEGLTATGADVDIWRPADWFSGRINSELAHCAGIIEPEYLS